MQEIRDHQQTVGVGKLPRLLPFMRVQLEERVEGQQLDTGAPVKRLAGNARKDLLHHAIGAAVAILEGLAKQEARGIDQAIIDAPGIHADAVQRSSELPGLAQPDQRFVPQTQHIPEAMPAQQHRPIGEAMRFLQVKRLPIEARQQHSPAAGPQINRREIACLHSPFPPLAWIGRRAAATPPSTLRILPVLLNARVGEAKKATASAISSGRMLTPSVVRLRYTSSS